METRHCICTNASRGLSATAGSLVIISIAPFFSTARQLHHSGTGRKRKTTRWGGDYHPGRSSATETHQLLKLGARGVLRHPIDRARSSATPPPKYFTTRPGRPGPPPAGHYGPITQSSGSRGTPMSYRVRRCWAIGPKHQTVFDLIRHNDAIICRVAYTGLLYSA